MANFKLINKVTKNKITKQASVTRFSARQTPVEYRFYKNVMLRSTDGSSAGLVLASR